MNFFERANKQQEQWRRGRSPGVEARFSWGLSPTLSPCGALASFAEAEIGKAKRPSDGGQASRPPAPGNGFCGQAVPQKRPGCKKRGAVPIAPRVDFNKMWHQPSGPAASIRFALCDKNESVRCDRHTWARPRSQRD